jgi:arylsulfatase
LGTSSIVAAATLTSEALAQAQKAAPSPVSGAAPPAGGKPNILVIWGEDIGIANISAYSNGLMGCETPNIDRIAVRNVRANSLSKGGCPHKSE